MEVNLDLHIFLGLELLQFVEAPAFLQITSRLWYLAPLQLFGTSTVNSNPWLAETAAYFAGLDKGSALGWLKPECMFEIGRGSVQESYDLSGSW